MEVSSDHSQPAPKVKGSKCVKKRTRRRTLLKNPYFLTTLVPGVVLQHSFSFLSPPPSPIGKTQCLLQILTQLF